MQIRTWVIKVPSKNVLNTLIAMVHKRELEEIFVASVDKDGAISAKFKKGDIVAILASKVKTIEEKLKKIAPTYLMDNLDDEMFTVDDEGAELKDVTYPESEEEELEMVERLK